MSKKNPLIARALGAPAPVDEFANQPIAQDSAFPMPEPAPAAPDVLTLEEATAVAEENLLRIMTGSSPESRSDISSPAEEDALRELDAKLNPPQAVRFEEWHVTVENGNPVHWDYVCRMYGIDPLFIELSDFRLQLLCTMRAAPTEPVAGEGSPTFLELCALEGFTVIRIKHEVSDLREGEVALYYEAHLKLDGPFRLDRKDASRDLYRANRWYRTKRSAQPFDAQEWGGIATSQSKPSKAVGLEYEAVLMDTNVALDAGWM